MKKQVMITPVGLALSALLSVSSIGWAASSSKISKADIEAEATTAVPTIQADVLTPSVLQEINSLNQAAPLPKVKERVAQNKTWRSERESASHPMADKILGNTLSQTLKSIVAAHPNQYANLVIIGEGATVLGSTYLTTDYYYGNKSSWRSVKRNEKPYISGDHIDHENKKHWALVDVPVMQNGKLAGMAEVSLFVTPKASA